MITFKYLRMNISYSITKTVCCQMQHYITYFSSSSSVGVVDSSGHSPICRRPIVVATGSSSSDGAPPAAVLVHLPALPDELEDRDETREPHPRQQHHEDAADVGQAQLRSLVQAVVGRLERNVLLC